MIFFIFCVFITVFTYKNVACESVKDSDQIMFTVKFSSESLQIWCMDSLYHANQYVGNYMFIYIYFLHFVVFFQYFT